VDAPDVAQRVIDAVNAHDLRALRALYLASARTLQPGWPEEAGPEYLLASYEVDFACVPDIKFEPRSSTTDGDRIVTELRITGTNPNRPFSVTSARRSWDATSTPCPRRGDRSTSRQC